jgi:hypothetical protein
VHTAWLYALGTVTSQFALYNTLAHSPVPYVLGLAPYYHIDFEVTQKGTYLLPEDSNVLPERVRAIV